MCDAVQDEPCEIDGVAVSNFVLPLYFTSGDELGGRNDFLGTVRQGGTTLQSFGINPGGYVGFYDPQLHDHDTFAVSGIAEKDARAAERLRIKERAGMTRRNQRYRHRYVKGEAYLVKG